MSAFPQLKKPPIIEAQLNFLADTSAGWKVYGSAGRVAEIFPTHVTVQPLQQFLLHFGNPPKVAVDVETGVAGFFLRKAGDPVVFQVRRDGFAFSRLEPYGGWEEFVAAAVSNWERYRAFMNAGELHGINLRYINRIQIPRRDYVANRDGFFTIAPRVPPGTGWGFMGVAHQSTLVTEDQRFLIGVGFSTEQPTLDQEIAGFTLDINVSPRPITGFSEIEKLLVEMRDLKNQAFFSIATEAAWKQYA